MLASSYPLLNIFWTMLWFFLFFAWIWLLIIVFGDIFRSHDLSGWGKALWTIFVVLVPWLGVLVYLIARGGKMQDRAAKEAQQQDQAFRSYVQDVAAPTNSADQLTKLADLKASGVISDQEFQTAKAKLLV